MTGDGQQAPRQTVDQAAGPRRRDPARSLAGCDRIVIVGRTGSGKTTLARKLAAARGVPHVELDALYFQPDLSTVPLDVLRERTTAAIAGERWVTDGNKGAVRDLVWPRADTVIWLDYALSVSLWRLARRALRRTSALKTQAPAAGGRTSRPKQLFLAAKECSLRCGRMPGSGVSIRGSSLGRRTSTWRSSASGHLGPRTSGWRALPRRRGRSTSGRTGAHYQSPTTNVMMLPAVGSRSVAPYAPHQTRSE